MLTSLSTHLGNENNHNHKFNVKDGAMLHCATTGFTSVWSIVRQNVPQVLCLNGIYKRFRDSETNMGFSPKTEQPSSTERDIAWVREIVKTERRQNVLEISDTTGICGKVVIVSNHSPGARYVESLFLLVTLTT